MDEQEQVRKFVGYLKQIGYPAESIVQNFQIGSQYADIAVLDVQTKQPIIIFELKMNHQNNPTGLAKSILPRIKSALLPLDVLTYLVIGIPGDPNYGVWTYVSKRQESGSHIIGVEKTEIPLYLPSLVGTRSRNIQKTKEVRQSTLDTMKWIAWIAGLLFLLLFALDLTNRLTVSTTQLILICIAVGLFILPFASKLKILGVEFERLSRTNDEITKKSNDTSANGG